MPGDLEKIAFLFFKNQIQNNWRIVSTQGPLNLFTYFVCAGQPAGAPVCRTSDFGGRLFSCNFCILTINTSW